MAKADVLAGALQEAGHSVWWDRQIQGGQRFSAAIDVALKDADAVIVLWSSSSVVSAWVQDEASEGRDSGRLVPVLLDRVEPPLGFRQYQSLDLAGWHGRGPPKQLDKIVSAVSALTPHITTRIADAESSRGSSLRFKPSGRTVAGALALAAFCGGTFIWIRTRPESSAPSVTVAASTASTPQLSIALAHGVALDLARYQAGPLSGISITEPQQSQMHADYRLEVGATASAHGQHADLSLIDRDATVIWTAQVDSASGESADLRQQASAQAGAVLACAVHSSELRPRLTQEVLKLYLAGCSRLANDNSNQTDASALRTFRQLTEKEPPLADGWAGLALLQFWSVLSIPDDEVPATMHSAQEHLVRAYALNPTLDLVYAAEARLSLPSDPKHWAVSLQALDRGLRANPDSALLYSERAETLGAIGRMQEAVQSARRAVELDPLSPRASDAYISTLAYSGQKDIAQRELEKAEQIWPGSTILEQTRFRFDARYGDAAAAQRLIKSQGNQFGLTDNAALDAFTEARMFPSKGNQDKAIAAYQEGARRDPTYVWGLVQALGAFNRADDAFATLQNLPTMYMILGSDILWRPVMRSIRADRRFMSVVDRIGLVRLWRTTGVWPDFCQDPQLPYDCQKEAAKYAN